MNVLVFGASAGLGRHVAETFACGGHDLLLVGGDQRDLASTASDLHLRFGVRAQACACRVRSTGDWLKTLEDGIRTFGPVDALMFPIGVSRDDDTGMLGLADAREIAETNFLAVAATVSLALPDMLRRGSGLIAGFGSIASARGRGRNVIYSAAKRALESYFESIRHLTAGTGVRVQYFHLGFVATQQAAGRRLLLPAADPARVARTIVVGCAGREGVFYTPWYWRWIVMALRLVPWRFYKRLSF